jgi:hypothetical protein
MADDRETRVDRAREALARRDEGATDAPDTTPGEDADPGDHDREAAVREERRRRAD